MMLLRVEMGGLFTSLRLTRTAAKFCSKAEKKVPSINKDVCCIFAVALLSRNHSMRNGLRLLVPVHAC